MSTEEILTRIASRNTTSTPLTPGPPHTAKVYDHILTYVAVEWGSTVVGPMAHTNSRTESYDRCNNFAMEKERQNAELFLSLFRKTGKLLKKTNGEKVTSNQENECNWPVHIAKCVKPDGFLTIFAKNLHFAG